MKILKIIMNHSKNMTEESVKAFIYKNFPNEVIRGLEYDEPKTIERALKLLGIKVTKQEEKMVEDYEDLYEEHASKSRAV